MVQKFLEDELTTELSKFTQSEGRILIKLIHRQTGISTYDLVKQLRNGLREVKLLKVNFKPQQC